jgi:hypothetical protein
LVIGVELESDKVRGFMSPVFQRDVEAILDMDGVGLVVVLVPMRRGYTFHMIHMHADGVIWYGGGEGWTRWSLGGQRSRAVGGKGSGKELFMFWAVRLNMFTQRERKQGKRFNALTQRKGKWGIINAFWEWERQGGDEGRGDSRGRSGHLDTSDGDRVGRNGGGFISVQAYSSGVCMIKFFDKLVGIDVGQGLPTVMRFRESFPPDQVLELVMLLSCTQDLFNFPFRLAINKVWDGFLIFVTIQGSFFVGS